MGTQFSEEFLLGYRAGHRDGFADAVILMRDSVTPHHQAGVLARREAQIARLLSGQALEQPNGDGMQAPDMARTGAIPAESRG